MKPAHICLFSTNFETIGLAWIDTGLVALQLPEKNASATRLKLLNKLQENGFSAQTTRKLPTFISSLTKKIELHLSGKIQDFSKTKIGWQTSSAFSQNVYNFCLSKLPAGDTITYGDLAKALGKPKSARAVGMVMGKNLIPLVVPCHRVISSSKKNRLCGFSAFGGIQTKEKLLQLEGVRLS